MKRILAVLLLVFFVASLGGCSGKSNDLISLTIESETDKDDWGGKEFCTHSFSVTKAGQPLFYKQPLPHNQKTTVYLPKTDEEYVMTFFGQGNKEKQYVCTPFKGNQDMEVRFSCNLRGGMHGLKSTQGILMNESK